MINHIISQTLKGKTINRLLMNFELLSLTISGKILELGGGRIKSSYFQFLQLKEPAEVTSIDIASERQPDIIADLEKPLPCSDGQFDAVLCVNLLEHIFQYRQLVAESYRVLKSGGKLIGYVPFLVKVHPDPNDYFRYTAQSLEHILRDVSFTGIQVRYVGRGPLTAAWSQCEYILPRVVRWVVTLTVFALDNFLLRLKPVFREKYPLGYVFIGIK